MSEGAYKRRGLYPMGAAMTGKEKVLRKATKVLFSNSL